MEKNCYKEKISMWLRRLMEEMGWHSKVLFISHFKRFKEEFYILI